MRQRRGGRRRCLRPGRTHPTAQEQATPVSVSHSHQPGEKGLWAGRRQSCERVSEIPRAAAWTELQRHGKWTPFSPSSVPRVLFGQSISPVSLSYRKTRRYL